MTFTASKSSFQAEQAAQSETDAARFHDRLRQLDTPALCAAIFCEVISPYGFDTFACGEIDPNDRDRRVFYIIDWTERWRQFYFQSSLVERNPVVGGLARRREPFTWTDLRHDKNGRLGDRGAEPVPSGA